MQTTSGRSARASSTASRTSASAVSASARVDAFAIAAVATVWLAERALDVPLFAALAAG